MTLKVGSLFSGIGGLDLGLERAGMQIKWQVEIDPFCQQVLEKHWPGVQRFSNVKNIQEIPYVDLICGGFPCQPISTCGRQQGDKDERWLWPEFYRIICMVKPKWILVENVVGLLSIQQGKLFGGILSDLAKSGYDAEWQVLSAAQFGAPHLRKRVFVIAHSNRELLQGSIRWTETRFFKDTYLPAQQLSTRWSKDNISKPFTNRGDDGFSNRVDRLRSLGNAVVPQVAEYIGKCILEAQTLYR